RLMQHATDQPPGWLADADGTRYTDVTLTNLDDVETARLADRVELSLVACDGTLVEKRTVPRASVFAAPVIAPRGRLDGHFSIPDAKGACFANAEVAGESEPGGLRVLGFFQLVTGEPPGVPASEQQNQLMSQVLELLGRPKIVTNDDLRRLEDEGKIPRG